MSYLFGYKVFCCPIQCNTMLASNVPSDRGDVTKWSKAHQLRENDWKPKDRRFAPRPGQSLGTLRKTESFPSNTASVIFHSNKASVFNELQIQTKKVFVFKRKVRWGKIFPVCLEDRRKFFVGIGMKRNKTKSWQDRHLQTSKSATGGFPDSCDEGPRSERMGSNKSG